MNEYKLIHLDFLQSFTNNDPGKMVKYIRMFLQSAPTAIDTMRKQLQTGDMINLRTTAHSLKPQLGYMGIDSLREQILRIEEYAGEHKKPDEIARLIEEVDYGCKLAFEELQDLVGKLS
jgi:HPt (histidine-containing phosphotransfer) domain-containing protein